MLESQRKKIGYMGGHTRSSGLWPQKPEPLMGAHIITLRRGYTHHGIYVGAGKVIHYAGLARGLRRGAVEEISLSGFAAGCPVEVVSGVPAKFDGREAVRRACSRIGEDGYRPLTNNCEHFCEWCLRGQHRSYQIERCLAIPSWALHITQGLIGALCSLARQNLPTFFSAFGESLLRIRATAAADMKIFRNGSCVRTNGQPQERTASGMLVAHSMRNGLFFSVTRVIYASH